MAFADPRDGDLEDDASSTARHTLLRHASYILLEISLPKLALAALLLLVVPAVLIGAAPKAAVWFADQLWIRVSEAGRWPCWSCCWRRPRCCGAGAAGCCAPPSATSGR